jgi:ADYC domain-containing protein
MIRIFAIALVFLMPTAAFAQDQVRLPGDSMNGRMINGPAMEGTELAAATLAGGAGGTMADGRAIQSVETWEGRLLARDMTGAPMAAGQELVGATLQGVAADGSWLMLRIDSVEAASGSADQDVLYHRISKWACGWTTDSTGHTVFRCDWTPLCGATPTDGPVASVPLQGRWNYSLGISGSASYAYQPNGTTFACQGYALEKCAVPLHYKPWVPGRGDLHRACVKMLRADYCGDGTHTQNGTPVHASDDVVINPWPSTSAVPAWKLEALWTPNGAACISAERLQGNEDLIKSACPDLFFNTPRCPTSGGMMGGAVLRNFCMEDPVHPGQCSPLQ